MYVTIDIAVFSVLQVCKIIIINNFWADVACPNTGGKFSGPCKAPLMKEAHRK